MNPCIVCRVKELPAGMSTCLACEPVLRAWAARGFRELNAYLEKVCAFEEFEARKASGHDPSPAD